MKRSRQREAILEILCATTSHPTADWIYDKVRERIPNISLGTVYRNLNILSENGEILKLDVGYDQSHYDGNTNPHNHFVCRRCHRISDIETEYDFNIDRIAENHFNGDIEYHTLLFYGTCNECLSEIN